MGGPFRYLWAGLAFIACAGIVARLLERPGGLFTEVGAAWVQAIGSVVAIGVAIALPRIDKAHTRRAYGEAAHAAALVAHQNIASVWLLAGGREVMGGPAIDFPERQVMIEELRRAAEECDAFPLTGSQSVAAVMHLRSMAACCRGAAEAIQESQSTGQQEFFARARRIANFAYHLLVLIARDSRLAEPPAPSSLMREGVPPHILKEVERSR